MDIQWVLQMPQQKSDSENIRPTSLTLRAGDLLTASVLEVEKGSDALLSIGQFKAYARLPLPVVTGQDIHIRVEAAGDNLRMVMMPRKGQAANLPAGGRLPINLFEPITDKPFLYEHSRAMAPGETLQARITGFEKNGLMLVDFGKFKAFAKIDVPVQQGQTVSLTVVKNDTGIAFAAGPKMPTIGSVSQPSADGSPPPVAPEMAAMRAQIQRFLDGAIPPEKGFSASLPTPTRGALNNLQQALSPVSSTGDMATLVARVRDFVENSGVYFEKRLEQAINHLQHRSGSMTPSELAGKPVIRDIMINDVKPNLLILKEFLDGQPPDPREADRYMLETLKSMVQRAVSHIEQQQSMATEKPMDPDLFQAFSHLLCLTDSPRNARLKVYYAKKGRDDAHKNPRVSLLLDMDRLGTVRTDLWMVGMDLNVTFFVMDANVKAAIEREHQRIEEMLNDTFNTVAISVVVNQNKIDRFEGEDLSLPKLRQVDLSI